MHHLRFLITCCFGFFMICNVQGQIDIANLDFSKWEMDTFNQSLVIKPKFVFDKDTIINFYDSKIDSTKIILSIRVNQRRHSLVGVFTGTKEYTNSNKYLITNYGVEKIDSVEFINMIDTITYEGNIRYYHIDLNKLGLSEKESADFMMSVSHYYLMGSDDSFKNSKYCTSHETVLWEDKDPPYNKKSTLVIRDSSKDKLK